MSEAAVPRIAEQPEVDRALAGRLEAAHGWCISQYAASLALLRPQIGATTLRVGDGVAIFAGRSAFSFAVGLGMAVPVGESTIDQVESFFTERQVPVRIDVTPFSDPSLSKILARRGYRISEITSVFVIDVRSVHPGWEIGPDVELRSAHNGDVPSWVDLLAQSFYVSDPGAHIRANMEALFAASGVLNTVALVDGRVAGVSAGMIAPQAGISTLYGSAVLPEFRGRGLHRAMLAYRLRALRDAGGELAMVTCTPGSTSERNLRRHGFVYCYEKATYAKSAL
jgi:GNAT superfamily N-acetyltransferase